MQELNWTSNNEDETIELGKKFAQFLNIKDIVVLEGELGAGKTEFIKGVCEFFSVEDIVTSPTFSIINQYTGLFKHKEFVIYHIDLYRIKNEMELVEIGFDECINDDNSIKFVEWPQIAAKVLLKPNYTIKIEADKKNEDLRFLKIITN